MTTCLVVLPMVSTGLAAQTQRVVRLSIASDGDELSFKPDHLTCPAGARVHLTFHHTGEISNDPHDWVLLKPGTEKPFIAHADKEPNDTVVVPSEDREMVLAATPLCQRGKTVTVTFVAPSPGDYPFVCSIPGHGETMRGILTVIA